MAQTQQPKGGGEAEFVRRIVSDPRNVPDVMRLYGYHGASSEEGHDRLYLNLDLSIYVEVAAGHHFVPHGGLDASLSCLLAGRLSQKIASPVLVRAPSWFN